MTDPGYIYVSKFIEPERAYRCFSYLERGQRHSDPHPMFVRRLNVPRSEAWMNDFDRSYTYGKVPYARTYDAVPWDDQVRLVRDWLRMHFGVHYEGCFLNLYVNGTDALDWHADDDPGIDHSKPIAVVSFGFERALHVRSNDRSWHNKFMLGHGSLLLMPAGSQQTHQHKIPKLGQTEIASTRISMTFRSLLR